jgi:hypothetical protein
MWWGSRRTATKLSDDVSERPQATNFQLSQLSAAPPVHRLVSPPAALKHLLPSPPKTTALSSCFVPAQASSPEPQTLLAQTTNEGPRTAFCPSGICRGKQWLKGTESWPSASALAVKSSSQRCVERERQSHQIRYSVLRGTVLEYRFLLLLFPSFHFPFPLVSSFLRLLDGAGYFSARAKAVGSGRLQVGPIPQSRSGNNGPVSLA